MRGKLFVWIYSIILLVLFGVCCYLMTIVNPPRLPEPEARRHPVDDDDIDPKEVQLPGNNPNYGLEKIPPGVDHDEFRKQVLAKAKKDDTTTDITLYDRTQPVVPPIWPSDKDEGSVDNCKIKELNSTDVATSLPVKGHRRSIKDDKDQKEKESPRAIVLKIIDDSGHKKIEIKFISEKNKKKTQKLRKNRSPNKLKTNITKVININTITKHKTNDVANEEVINVKANDIIVLNLVDDSETLLDKSFSCGANNTEDIQNFDNKTTRNETKPFEFNSEKVREINQTNSYTFSLMFNNDNISVASGNFNIEEHNSVSIPSTGKFENASSETTPL